MYGILALQKAFVFLKEACSNLKLAQMQYHYCLHAKHNSAGGHAAKPKGCNLQTCHLSI